MCFVLIRRRSTLRSSNLRHPTAITILQRGWRSLDLSNIGGVSDGPRFILTGYLWEGVRFDGYNIGQRMFSLETDRLHYIPKVKDPNPAVDQFYYLQDEGDPGDG